MPRVNLGESLEWLSWHYLHVIFSVQNKRIAENNSVWTKWKTIRKNCLIEEQCQQSKIEARGALTLFLLSSNKKYTQFTTIKNPLNRCWAAFKLWILNLSQIWYEENVANLSGYDLLKATYGRVFTKTLNNNRDELVLIPQICVELPLKNTGQ